MRFGHRKIRERNKPFGSPPQPTKKQPYCGKCGTKCDGVICGECSRAYREWVERNCSARGGNEELMG